ncbi:MAG: membrane protein insertase YidC, partial [Bacteroidota bacterium]
MESNNINNIIGIILIFGLFYLYMVLNKPSEEELAQKALQDSLARTEQIDSSKSVASNTTTENTVALPDSMQKILNASKFGAFGESANGTEAIQTLENDKVRISFSNKGGVIKEVLLKDYKKKVFDENKEYITSDVLLLEDNKNRFDYILPVAGKGNINTGDLFFTPTIDGNTIRFKADAGNGRSFEQVYTLKDDYTLDYDINLNGLSGVLEGDTENIQLKWINYLDRIENNKRFEKIYSTTYYKEAEKNPNHCSCTGPDVEEPGERPIKWVSNVNQFFNSTIIADDYFAPSTFETIVMDDEDNDMKKLISTINIPIAEKNNIGMTMYVGPNEFDRLKAFDMDIEDVIPYGSSILGTINRWVIRPAFNGLRGLIGNMGITILILTFLIKLVLYPLTYKMLHSQAKMGALKPELAGLREKFKDDQQKIQMESMKIYREYGVNPAGGCMPMVIQMPIWIALYRFFPASIEFRQQSFLWAQDLSSFDNFFNLPFDIPFVGAHISLFTVLWVITQLGYTFYMNSKLDMSGQMNPMFKYMQYFMPVMFFGFFNSYASGLT